MPPFAPTLSALQRRLRPACCALGLGLLGLNLAYSPLALAQKAARAVPAKAPVPQVPDARLGAIKADTERCVECHGPDGHASAGGPAAESHVPKLAGQSLAYIVKQVADFRSGARRHDTMNMMARTVEPADIVDIAAHFAGQSPMSGDGGRSALGERLYTQGDPQRGVPACTSCHAPGAVGQGTAPRLAGQSWRYLEKQLFDWRSGERRNSPDGAMEVLSRGLSDSEIRALTDYLAGLP
jgi:cytochrome c553